MVAAHVHGAQIKGTLFLSYTGQLNNNNKLTRNFNQPNNKLFIIRASFKDIL